MLPCMKAYVVKPAQFHFSDNKVGISIEITACYCLENLHFNFVSTQIQELCPKHKEAKEEMFHALLFFPLM